MVNVDHRPNGRIIEEMGKVRAPQASPDHPALAAAKSNRRRYQWFTKLVTLIDPMPVAKSHPVVVG